MNELLKKLISIQPEKTRHALNQHVIALRVYRHNAVYSSKKINSKIADIEYALKAYYS